MSYPYDSGPQAPRGRSSGRDPVRVLESLKHDAVSELASILTGFWGMVEEQVRLTALAGQDYRASQDDRAALNGLMQRATTLTAQYRHAIQDEFDHWRDTKPTHADGSNAMSLMSESELRLHLAGVQATETFEQQFKYPLEVLEDRLSSLAVALRMQRRNLNPVRPSVPMSAFIELFGPDDLTPSLQSIVFPLYVKRLGEALGATYTKLNTSLEAAGFSIGAPSMGQSSGGRHTTINVAMGSGASGASGWVPDGGMVESYLQMPGGMHAGAGFYSAGSNQGSGAMSQADALHQAQQEGRPPRYRDVVREQLRTWRARSARGAASGQSNESALTEEYGAAVNDDGQFVDLPMEGNFLAMEDLLNIASLLQGDDPTPYAQALAGERSLPNVIREEILGGVKQMGLDSTKTRFSVDEEDAIDLVGILFQSLFEANDLMTRARAMYGKLVVPYLKIALTDDSLFNHRSHPARQLLDALTEACDGNNGDTPQDRETLERAERAVERIVGEYQDDNVIFELAATELRDQLDQQRRRSELAERRAAEAIHGRERLQQARRDAEALVASRLADRLLTTPVARFLNDQWRHYLVQMWLRDGVDSERYRAAIALGDSMLQVDADAARAQGAAVADQLLSLQVPLGDCYTSCGLDAASARDLMARIISALALPDTLRQVHASRAGELDLDQPEATAKTQGIRLVAGTDTIDFDANIAARMRRLRVGQGLRLIDDSGHESAARIAWISPLTSRFLIVNRRGMRKLVVSPEELAAMVSDGRVTVRSVDAPFDEAMKQVWQRLNEVPPDADDDIATAITA